MSESTPNTQRRRSGSRSRRSHPSFSDLRLAPLSVPQPKQQIKTPLDSPRTPGSLDPEVAHAYRMNHPSYLAGRSAPTSPGILSRSSSRRRQVGGGLSRKQTPYDDGHPDTENIDPSYFTYNAVQTGPNGALRDHPSGYLDERPKSRSESGLQDAPTRSKSLRTRMRPLSTAAPPSTSKANRKSYHAGTMTPGRRTAAAGPSQDDDWLTHATSFTASLLAEGKTSTWISSHGSTSNLHSYASQANVLNANSFAPSADDSDDNTDEPLAASAATIVPARNKLHPSATAPVFRHDTDELAEPLRSPSLTQGWGSRFGSRQPSAANSRRGSRVALNKLSGFTTPHHAHNTSTGGGGSAAKPETSRPTTSHSTAAANIDAVLAPAPEARPAFVDPAVQAEIESSLAAVRAQRERGYFDANHPHQYGSDGEDATEDDENVEEEVKRLAQTPGFGLGGALGSGFGIIDRLVGMSTFHFDGEDVGGRREDDEEDGVASSAGAMGGVEEKARDIAGGETGTDSGVRSAEGNRKRRSLMLDLQGMFSKQQQQGGEQAKGKQGEEHADGGWNDAAWLLSVASKVLL